MIAIDNFELLKKELLEFVPGEFYFVAIVARGKDLPVWAEMMDGQRNIKFFEIHSEEDLNSREQEIKHICSELRVRAYITISRRSYEGIADRLIDTIKRHVNGITKLPFLNQVYNACVSNWAIGKEEPELWFVDVDEANLSRLPEVRQKIDNQITDEGTTTNILMEIPTPNGVHILTVPFDTSEIKKWDGPSLDVHGRESFTVLYSPQSIVNEKDKLHSITND